METEDTTGQAPRIMELIANAPWREAVTYRDTWPHEYVVVKKDGQEELLAAFCERITRGEGVECQFFPQRRPYLFLGDYKYWIMVECGGCGPDAGDCRISTVVPGSAGLRHSVGGYGWEGLSGDPAVDFVMSDSEAHAADTELQRSIPDHVPAGSVVLNLRRNPPQLHLHTEFVDAEHHRDVTVHSQHPQRSDAVTRPTRSPILRYTLQALPLPGTRPP